MRVQPALVRALWLLFALGLILAIGVGVAFLLAPENGESVSGYATAAIEMLAISILAVLLLLFGHRITGVKVGSVQLELQELVNETVRKEAENKKLQAKLATRASIGPDNADAEDGLSAFHGAPDLPAPTVANDTQKGRFGRRAKANGFQLIARFPAGFTGSRIAKVALVVTGTEGKDVEQFVRFYLDRTFDPNEIDVVPQSGTASLELLTTGGFTVGAWLAATNTLLELDLAEVPGAPHVIRDN